MREIKFRAWNGSKMFPVSRIEQRFEELRHRDGITYVPTAQSVELASGEYLKFDPLASMDERIMQYTGLKDKNGVEIYEGDIIETLWAQGPQRGEVKYNPEIASFMSDGGGIFAKNELITVLGNIYENPELLTAH